VDETVQGAFLFAETMQDGFDKAGVAILVQGEDGVGDVVCGLEKSRLLHRREVGYVAQVAQDSPRGAQRSEALHPDLGPLVEPSLSEDDQAALRVVGFLFTSHEEDVETPAEFLCGSPDGVLTVEARSLLNDCGEQNQPWLSDPGDPLGHPCQNGVACR